jgi:hypothetical protein
MSDGHHSVQADRLDALRQARAKAQQDLQMSCDRRRRAELERTITQLDQALELESRGF